jgi:hypothetical protein
MEYFKQWTVAAFYHIKLFTDISSVLDPPKLIEDGAIKVMALWEKVEALNSFWEDNSKYQDACVKLKNTPVIINGT